MLTIRNLTKTYAGSNEPAVNNLSLEVADGQIFGFIGPNGAGKSTTIRSLIGSLLFDSGSVTLDGVDLCTEPLKFKQMIGYVSDSHQMFDKLTGIEMLNFIFDVYGVPTGVRHAQVDEYLDLFELTDKISSPIKSYSHGMKQKLSIICALIHRPKLWILDEPLTGLDPKSSFALKQLMRKYADEGNIVFFSSHVLDVVEKVCDSIGIIDNGRLVTTCSMEQLRERGFMGSSLEEVFLKITDKESYARLASASKKASDEQPESTEQAKEKSTDGDDE